MKNRMLTKLAAMSMTAAMSFSVFTAIPGGVVFADPGDEQTNEETTDPEPAAPTGIVIEDGVATLYSDYEIDSPLLAYSDYNNGTPMSTVSVFDLNGYTLTYTGSDPLFVIDNKSFEIKDSSTAKTGKISSVGGANIITTDDFDGDKINETITLSGGTLEGKATSYDGTGNSAIYLFYGDTFTMNGGTICNFSSKKGGAVYLVDSQATISQGVIENCYASQGGAVYADIYSGVSSVTMNGGTIRNCSADNGGGIYSHNSKVFINSGSISSNTALINGGGICLIENSILDDQCPLYLFGGFIQNNSCASFKAQTQGGGGIYVEVQNPTADGCVYIENCTVQNNSNSTGNKNNLYLAKADNKIFFDGKMFSTVGVSRYDTQDGQELATVSNKNYSARKNLVSDNPGFELQVQVSAGTANDKLLFVEKEVVEPCEIRGCNLVLDGSSIGIKYKVFVPDSYTEEQIANLRGQGTFAWNPDSTKRGIGISDVDVEPISTTRDADGCLVFLIKVYSTDMSVDVRFALTDKPVMSGGEEILSNTDFSVAGYAETLLASPSEYNLGTKEIGIIKAMLNYGAASQKKFGVCTDNLANDCIKGTDHHDEFVEPSNVTPRTLTQTDTEHIKFYAASIVFEGTVSLKLYFRYSDIDPKKDVVITVDGTQYTPSTPSNSSYCYIKINGIEPKNIDHQYNVVVTEGADEVIDLSYSPLNYIDGIFKKNSTDEMGTLVKALYTYYKTLNVGNQ